MNLSQLKEIIKEELAAVREARMEKVTIDTPAGKRYRVEREYEPKTVTEKEYKASLGSIAALEKHDDSCKKAVEAGDFDWADEPYAACQAAHIAKTGKTTRE
jgi:hypothetical protein